MKFTVFIVPKGQMRARHAVINGFSRTYKDPKQAKEEEALISLLGKHQPGNPMQGPLLLGVKAFLPIPESRPKGWKEAAATERMFCTTKPDMSNIIKHVEDCMTQARFWGDDAQVVGYLPHSYKMYSPRPRLEIEIIRAKQPEIPSRKAMKGRNLQHLPGLQL